VFAQDAEGGEIAAGLHDSLLKQHVWIWKTGCLENVTGHEEKGEDAILDQELAIGAMDAVAIQAAMPAIVQCFGWLDWLRASSA
jgi:putative ATP-dependent endonuclease of the OLD family